MTRLIDADALTMTVFKKAIDDVFMGGNTDMHKLLSSIVAHQPTIDAVPVRHGKWTRHTLGSTGGYGTTVMHQCSECESMTISRFRYCPNCGARMDAERKEE